MKRGWQWPLLVTAALLFTVGVNVVMLFAAGGDPNGTVVEPDYYRKAVEWDRTMARRAASDRLGWVSTAEVGALAAGRRDVRVTLRDRDGAPITDAAVEVTLIHNLDAAVPVHGTLRAQDGGYAASFEIPRGGQWEVRVHAERAAARHLNVVRVEAP